ncbi:MAG: cytochrome c-type biogenesis protein CcmH [Alicyclobacillus sp.]|nr:cytochrome c-type biogenesis protein CcmH [Alicyclobacillus sp.]
MAVAVLLWIVLVIRGERTEPLAAGSTLQQEVLAIANHLRIPGEQDTLTAAVSTDPAAQHMRYEIQQMLLAGKKPADIVQQMIAEYGPGAYAAPPRQGVGWLAWGMPAAAGLGLLTGATLYARRRFRQPWRRTEPAQGAWPLDTADAAGEEGKAGRDELAAVEQRLRDFV